MKTIHIPYVENFYKPQPDGQILVSDIPKIKKQSQELLKELYEKTLKNDSLFHFFYEPDCLIIRIGLEDALNKTKKYLEKREVKFEEYDYPYAPQGKYGEEKDGLADRNFKLFLAVYHANAVAALTMNEEDHFGYIERLFHTAFNPRLINRHKEGLKLKEMAELKLGKKL